MQVMKFKALKLFVVAVSKQFVKVLLGHVSLLFIFARNCEISAQFWVNYFLSLQTSPIRRAPQFEENPVL